MSYCRKGPESDVYIYDGADGIVCCHCLLGPDFVTTDDDVTRAANQMLEHVEAHKKAGHKVPAGAIDRLWRLASEVE